ncbi:MAG: hypothetical protein QM504_10250 [Pseudomonadota bacterium]
MSVSLYKEFGFDQHVFVDITAVFAKIKILLVPYYTGGLPDDVDKMSQKDIDQWFVDNRKDVIPALYRDDLRPLQKVGVGMVINCMIHDSETICVQYDDHDSIVSYDGMANFVFKLVEAETYGETYFID